MQDIITVAEAARMMQISDQIFLRLIRTNRITGVKKLVDVYAVSKDFRIIAPLGKTAITKPMHERLIFEDDAFHLFPNDDAIKALKIEAANAAS